MGERWRNAVWRRLDYEPSPEQLAFHKSTARLRLVAGGERGGKSFSTAMEALGRGPHPGGLGWIVGATYELARPEALYIVDALVRLNALAGKPSVPNSGPCTIRTLWGETIVTRSSDDVLKIAARAPNWVLMVEAAQQTHEAYLRLSGRLTQERGWMVMSGTFEGANDWYHEMYRTGQAVNDLQLSAHSIPSWSNLAVFPGGRDDPEIKRMEASMPADRFMERYGAVPCPPHSLVFREFRHLSEDGKPGHVQRCDYDARLPVDVWVDPGWATAYAVVAVQYHGDEVHCIDEIYVQSMTHQEVIYEMHRRPWGLAVNEGVIDFAGRQHQADRSAEEVWRASDVTLRSQPVSIEAGIDRVKTFLRDPLTGKARLFVDPRCKGLIREFGLYRYRENSQGDAVSDKPIDLHNHALKALGYGLVDKYGACGRAPLPAPTQRAGVAGLVGAR